MIWNKYFLPSFLLLVLVAVLHWIASVNFFYWTVWWYDIMMHFLGGAWVVLCLLWIIYLPIMSRVRPYVNVYSIFLGVIVVGIAWEFHELFFRFVDTSKPDYWPDTIKDMIMDSLGAIVAIIICRRDIKSISGKSQE